MARQWNAVGSQVARTLVAFGLGAVQFTADIGFGSNAVPAGHSQSPTQAIRAEFSKYSGTYRGLSPLIVGSASGAQALILAESELKIDARSMSRKLAVPNFGVSLTSLDYATLGLVGVRKLQTAVVSPEVPADWYHTYFSEALGMMNFKVAKHQSEFSSEKTWLDYQNAPDLTLQKGPGLPVAAFYNVDSEGGWSKLEKLLSVASSQNANAVFFFTDALDAAETNWKSFASWTEN